MSTENRWTVEELLARYELEPSLSDVFVEGSFDREVLAKAFDQPASYSAFYEIDVVEVTGEMLHKHGLTTGNKQRVIALSRELNAVPHDALVVCLVDRDLDHWFGPLEQSRRLRWTMYCSLEGHFLTQQVVNDVVVTGGRARVKKVDDFVNSLADTLKKLYCLRLADRQTNLNLKWVALKKYLQRNDDKIAFDVDGYIVAVLNTNAMNRERAKFTDSYCDWMNNVNCDVRLASRGHDYSELLAWSIIEFGGDKNFGSRTAVERLFVLLTPLITTINQELQ